MKFSSEERQRLIDLAREYDLEITFDNEVTGIFVGDETEPSFNLENIFPELFLEEWVIEEQFDLGIMIKPPKKAEKLLLEDDNSADDMTILVTEAA